MLVHCQTQIDSQSQLNFEPSENGITTFLINNSPLTKFHSLVCPRLNDGLPQIMTKECIELAIDLIAGLNDHSYRIGYNSLGAFSSVNHLHLHLIHVTENLYVEDAVGYAFFVDGKGNFYPKKCLVTVVIESEASFHLKLGSSFSAAFSKCHLIKCLKFPNEFFSTGTDADLRWYL